MKDSFVVIELGGSQHIVSDGDELVVNHLDGKVGDFVSIDSVLLVQKASKVEVGSPFLDYTVTAEILQQFKGKKIQVRTYKAKSRYRRKIGHRQSLTKLEIGKITKKRATTATKSKASTLKKPTKTKATPKTA